MMATRITYGPRITPSGDHRRWCNVCGTQRSTANGKFIAHKRPDTKPDDPDCPNSGQKVNKVESMG